MAAAEANTSLGGDDNLETDAIVTEPDEDVENVTTNPQPESREKVPEPEPEPIKKEPPPQSSKPKGSGDGPKKPPPTFPSGFPFESFNAAFGAKANGGPVFINQIGHAGHIQIGNTFTGCNFNANVNPPFVPKPAHKPNPRKTVVPDHILNSKAPVTVDVKTVVAEHLGYNWRNVARELGFSEGQIQTFNIDNYGYGVKEAIIQMLNSWTQEKGDEATLGVLAKAMSNRDAGDIALKLAKFADC